MVKRLLGQSSSASSAVIAGVADSQGINSLETSQAKCHKAPDEISMAICPVHQQNSQCQKWQHPVLQAAQENAERPESKVSTLKQQLDEETRRRQACVHKMLQTSAHSSMLRPPHVDNNKDAFVYNIGLTGRDELFDSSG